VASNDSDKTIAATATGGRARGSDRDADGESDVEWDERPPEKAREEQPASLRDFESVRVGRGFFSEVCFYPGFEEAMTGTFGRVGVGQDPQRRTLYKMAQIKGRLLNFHIVHLD
jgi:RNA polymerase-associated protein RTF1